MILIIQQGKVLKPQQLQKTVLPYYYFHSTSCLGTFFPPGPTSAVVLTLLSVAFHHNLTGASLEQFIFSGYLWYYISSRVRTWFCFCKCNSNPGSKCQQIYASILTITSLNVQDILPDYDFKHNSYSLTSTKKTKNKCQSHKPFFLQYSSFIIYVEVSKGNCIEMKKN